MLPEPQGDMAMAMATGLLDPNSETAKNIAALQSGGSIKFRPMSNIFSGVQSATGGGLGTASGGTTATSTGATTSTQDRIAATRASIDAARQQRQADRDARRAERVAQRDARLAQRAANQGNGNSGSGNDGSLADRVSEIVGSNSGLMQQAQTLGLNQANRRGLANSSIAVNSQMDAMLSAAVPIASQEYNDKLQRDLQAEKLASDAALQNDAQAQQTKIAEMELAGKERSDITAAISQMNSNRFNAIASTLNNPDIPADARNAVIQSINAQYDSAMNYYQNLYGVSLSGVTPGAAAAA